MNETTSTTDPIVEPAIDLGQTQRIRSAVASRAFAMLSSVSPAGFPHAAGVQYASVDSSDGVPGGFELYVHTMRSSRKARNVAADGRVGLVIPVRKLPVGPPFTVQFQGRAQLLEMDDPEIVAHHSAGRLKTVSSHGELDEPDGVFLKITPGRTIHTYGIGVSVMGVARDPLHNGARSTRVA